MTTLVDRSRSARQALEEHQAEITRARMRGFATELARYASFVLDQPIKPEHLELTTYDWDCPKFSLIVDNVAFTATRVAVGTAHRQSIMLNGAEVWTLEDIASILDRPAPAPIPKRSLIDRVEGWYRRHYSVDEDGYATFYGVHTWVIQSCTMGLLAGFLLANLLGRPW